MPPPANTARYKNHRFPAELISHGVWLYYRFTLSYRDVQELLFERGVAVSHEAIRQWCRKFGQDDANRLRRRRPQPGDTWHLDEGFLPMNGERHYRGARWIRTITSWISSYSVDATSRRQRTSSASSSRVCCTSHGCSSPINSKATAPRSARSSLASSTARAALSITGVSTRIGRHGNASGACRALSQRVMPSAFSLRTVLSPNTSDRDGICCLR